MSQKFDALELPCPVPVGGRFLFRDDFNDLQQWDIIAGSPSVSGSILTLSGTDAEVRSKRKFLYGLLIVIAKSSASGNLQIGFTDGGDNYVVWSGGNLRYKSTVDNVEGVTTVSITETNYNIFMILWHPDEIVIWVNGTSYTPYTGVKIPNKPMSIQLKNLSTGTSSIDVAVVYPELAGVWLGSGVGGVQTALSISAILGSGTSTIGYIRGKREKLLAAPYTDTTTPLGANASYTGTARDRQLDSTNFEYYKIFHAQAISDQSGTLIIQESPDNTTWVTVKSVATASVTNPDGTTVQVAEIIHQVVQRYVRVAYRNGATAQTSFRLQSKLGTD